MKPSLAEVEALVGQLTEADRVTLQERLSFGQGTALPEAEAEEAIAAFRRELDRVAAAPLSATETLFLDRESRACSLSMLASGSAAIPDASPDTKPVGTSSTD